MNESDIEKISSDGLTGAASELLVATAEGSDQRVDQGVSEVLRMLRHVLKMDAVFVAEFVDGHRVFRHVDVSPDAPQILPGQSDPLEASWCQRVVDGRLPQLIPKVAELPNRDQLPEIPFEIGTHLSTPVILKDGRIYGTLCCFSCSPNEDIRQNDLTNLRAVAAVLATHIYTPIRLTPPAQSPG